MKILLDQLIPNPEQPRLAIDLVELQGLADSIRDHGLLNPISVEGPLENGKYIILDGERRWRAHQLIGLTEIEVNVSRPALNGSGRMERLLLGIIGNLQRQDMNIIERATAYQRLREMGMTYAEIGKACNMAQSMIPGNIKLLELPLEIRELYAQGKLPFDQRVTVAFLELEAERATRLARQAAAKGMPAKRILLLAKRLGGFEPEKPEKKAAHNLNQSQVARTNKVFTARAAYGHWNALAQVKLIDGEVSAGENIQQAAIETCRACALYEDASQNVCRDCPAVDLIRRLVKQQPG